MYRTLPGIAMLSVALITGCGATSQAGGESADTAGNDTSATETKVDAEQSEDPSVKVENMIADCMKQQGFKYIPNPISYETVDSPRFRYGGARSYLQSDSDVRKWREKYGFGYSASEVYPNDPQVAKRDPSEAKNPNDAIVEELDSARRNAYFKALTGSTSGHLYEPKTDDQKKNAAKLRENSEKSCQGKTSIVWAEDADKRANPKQKKENHRLVLKFQNDSDVLAAAKEYGDCMKERGYQIEISDPTPLSVISAVTGGVMAIPEAGTTDNSSAKQKLAKEVKLALADVDCRGSYAKIVRTKYPAVLDAEQTEGAG